MSKEINEVQEVKNELRLMIEGFLKCIDGCETAVDIVNAIGEQFGRLDNFAKNTFVVDKPEEPKKSNIIIP